MAPRQPEVGPDVPEPEVPAPDGPEPAGRPSTARGIGVGIGVGLAASISVAGLVYAIAAIPLFLLAQVSPDGRDRPEFRTALVVALVVGGILGLLVGAVAGVWAGRGGRLPTDRQPYLDT